MRGWHLFPEVSNSGPMDVQCLKPERSVTHCVQILACSTAHWRSRRSTNKQQWTSEQILHTRCDGMSSQSDALPSFSLFLFLSFLLLSPLWWRSAPMPQTILLKAKQQTLTLTEALFIHYHSFKQQHSISNNHLTWCWSSSFSLLLALAILDLESFLLLLPLLGVLSSSNTEERVTGIHFWSSPTPPFNFHWPNHCPAWLRQSHSSASSYELLP